MRWNVAADVAADVVADVAALVAGVVVTAVVLLAASTASAPSRAAEPVTASVDGTAAARELLAAQRDAWNRGDLGAFMPGDRRGDDVGFASSDAFGSGWQTTLDRYRHADPDAGATGRLDFELVELRAPRPDAVPVFGRRRPTRAADMPDAVPHGLFALLVERTAVNRAITREHPSAAERPR